jgi:hypothetical protein
MQQGMNASTDTVHATHKTRCAAWLTQRGQNTL